MADRPALKTALETDSRYADAIGQKNEVRVLLALLAKEDSQTIFLTVDTETVLNAIGSGIRRLTADQLNILRILTGRDTIDFTKAAIRAEMQQLFAGDADTTARLVALARRNRTYSEAFGGVSREDLWAVLKDIPGSYMALSLAKPSVGPGNLDPGFGG